MAITIDELEIQIESQATNATRGIDALAASLQKLETAVGGSSTLAPNLTNIANALRNFNSVGKINLSPHIKQLERLNTLVPTLGGTQATQLSQNLVGISGAISTFSAIPKVSLTPIANGISSLNAATSVMDSARLQEFSMQIRGIADGLSHLNNVGKTNIGSVVNALKKIPEITAALNPEVIAVFSAKVRELTAVMTPLAEKMDSVARGFNALPTAIKKTTTASSKAIEKNNSLSKSYGGLSTRLAQTASKYMVLYYAAVRVADVFADWFNESNNYIEALNLFKVSMGDAAEGALDYAESLKSLMGIDPAEWITNQGVFQRMSTGFGIASDQAEIMSQNLTQLAYDMASFFNTDVETAMQKLQSGMSGQIKGLKAWGYNLSVAALQETALSLGIEQSVRTMTEAQKAQLRYITLIQKSNGIMGDMAKTLTTPANAMRILESQLTQLKRALGDIISVLVTRFIPAIQAFVELATEAAKTLSELMGFEIKELPTNNLEMGSDVIEGIGDSANDTEEDLESLKKQLAGFDELNILKDNTKQNASFDLGIELPSYDFLGGAEISTTIKEIKEDFLELVEIFKNSDFSIAFARIKEFIGKIKAQFEELDSDNLLLTTLSTVITTLGSAVNLVVQVITPLLEALNIPQTILRTWTLLLNLLGAIEKVINAITPALKSLANAFAPIISWINGTFEEGLSAISDVFLEFGYTIEDLSPTFENIGKNLSSLIGKIWAFIEPLASTIWKGSLDNFKDLSDVLTSLLECIVVLVDGILGDLDGEFENLTQCLQPLATVVEKILGGAFGLISSIFKDLSSNILPTLTNTLSNLITVVIIPLANLISSVLTPVIEIVSDALGYLWQYVVTPLANALGGTLGVAFGEVTSTLNDYVIPVVGVVITALTWLWNNVLSPIADFVHDVFAPAFEEAFKSIGEIIDSFAKILGGLITFVSGVFTNDLSKALEGVKSIFVGIFEGIGVALKTPINVWIGMFEGLTNKIIDGWNWVKKSLNDLKIDIPEWLGGGTFGGFNLEMSKHITIPRFEFGGFPTMGEMFIARERGPEFVGRIGNKNAVANNDQIVTSVAQGVYNAMMAARSDEDDGSGKTARIFVQIGEQVVGEAAVKFINGQIIQTGVSPIYS